jgi:2-succinyl-5-enolpyruvyl-6-hydroxy-3-cyclohexene-1-carboxylate synthase
MADAPVTVQATFTATLVDEWVRAGVRHAVVAPGSRSTPLALALVERDEIAVHVFHDERAAGFAALGIGAATATPAVVLTTSGTAATHLHAAVVEAHLGHVPMLVCTADRPPELRDVGAPQTIDQTHLYGRAARWFVDPGVADDATSHTWRALAARAAALTTAEPPGPVHVNLPFRDPLMGRAGPVPPGRADGVPWTTVPEPAVVPVVVPEGRVLVVAGGGAHPSLGSSGWPVLADPRSGLEGPSIITHADVFLRHPVTADELRPEVVVRVGPPPASRVVNEWLDASGAEQLVVSRSWRDPGHRAAMVTTGALALPEPKADWLDQWRAVDDVAESAIAGHLAGLDRPTEPYVARSSLAALPAGARLVVASSMPVRDLEWYARPRHDVHVHANRGANGIDGTIATAIGVAIGSRAPTAVLLGDIAFLHDSTALIGLQSRDVDLVIVVVDNDGGGIFSFLPQASSLEDAQFEQLFGTPHGVRVEALAAVHGIVSLVVEDPAIVGSSIRSAMDAGGPWLVVVRTDRADNARVHAELNAAVAAALEPHPNLGSLSPP